MNDFPDLLPPPARDLTPAQRARLRDRLADPSVEDRGHPWLLAGVAAAVVLACVGGAVALSDSVDDEVKQELLQPVESIRPSPLSFVDDGGGNCLEGAPRTIVTINTVTTSRPVVLTGVALTDAVGVRIGDSWVAEVDPEKGAEAGNFEEGAGGLSDSLGWRDRRPLESARLEPGKTYRLFFRVTFTGEGQYGGSRYTYLEDGKPASTELVGTSRARERC